MRRSLHRAVVGKPLLFSAQNGGHTSPRYGRGEECPWSAWHGTRPGVRACSGVRGLLSAADFTCTASVCAHRRVVVVREETAPKIKNNPTGHGGGMCFQCGTVSGKAFSHVNHQQSVVKAGTRKRWSRVWARQT